MRRWRTAITIRDGYEQREAGLLTANLAGLPEQIGSMGLSLPGYDIEIIVEAGVPLPAGVAGGYCLSPSGAGSVYGVPKRSQCDVPDYARNLVSHGGSRALRR